MGKTSRIISIFLVVVMVAALLATAAFAASQKRVSGTGGMVTVDTGDQKWYQFWMDFLPTGQGFTIAGANSGHPVFLAAYSIVIMIVCNVAGILGFLRKDLK